VDNLHAILLMEGNLNVAMKIFIGTCMIANALHLNLIPAECYGSCPGCTAMQVSLTCTLMADITQQSWATLAVASVDFCTCYDSVAHPPSSIACQNLSAASSILETIFTTIQNMKIFLQMAHGDSSTFYGGPSMEGLPFQGVCQGNGTSPALWLATSILLIEMLCCHGHVSFFQCPVSQWSVSLVGLLYINDCDLFIFLPSANQGHQAIQDLQENIQLWQGRVQATGGSLALKNAHGAFFPTITRDTGGFPILPPQSLPIWLSPMILDSTLRSDNTLLQRVQRSLASHNYLLGMPCQCLTCFRRKLLNGSKPSAPTSSHTIYYGPWYTTSFGPPSATLSV